MLIYQKIKKFLPIILGLIFILILVFFAWPEYQKNNFLKQEIETKQNMLINIQNNLALLENFEIDKINKILPNEPEIPELMIQLESLAQKNGLLLKSINFNKSTGQVMTTVKLAGSYQAFKNYLNDLEINLRITDVININFESPEQKMGSYNFNLTIRNYYGF